MIGESLTVALISDVFHGAGGSDRLHARLDEARARGAALAVLPELALNPWSPASRTSRDEDAEPPAGIRHQLLSDAAKRAGIGVIGGAIVLSRESGRRHNTTLIFDREGRLVSQYAKVHLPEEEGFWETSHYEPGMTCADVVREFGMPLGVQVCSDINRPVGSQILVALGAEAIINPRATEAATFDRWRLVFRAVAMTTSAYVLSVNRPAAELGVPLGGPSVVVGPGGDVIVESHDPIVVATLDRAVITAARRRYPGYLASYATLYRDGWQAVANRLRAHGIGPDPRD